MPLDKTLVYLGVSPNKLQKRMKKHVTEITYKSIEQSLNKDYKRSIAEFIWNGFDANATQVMINYEANPLGFITSLSIADNGSGIEMETLEKTFGKFLDSQKAVSNNYSGIVKGKKGKGRFSFVNFCTQAIWRTTFKKGDDYLSYDILLIKENLPFYNTDNNKVSKIRKTETVVEFFNFFNLKSDHLEAPEFFEYLTAEFGWYLFLNKEHGCSLTVNGRNIDYRDIIEDNVIDHFVSGEHNFKIDFIKWKRNIGDKYYHYFLNSELKIVDRQHTSFNNKTQDFHHSVYVSSLYFNQFLPSDSDDEAPTFTEFGKTKNDPIYKALIIYLNKLISSQEKNFIREKKAQQLIVRYKQRKIFPEFRNNVYDQIREKDLELVVKEMYCLNPKIFQNLKEQQSKTIVGFLNLLLDSEQRDNILTILESLVELSDEERLRFAEILKDTKITHITALINELKSRFNTVGVLKKLVFELEKFTNERDHIQKVVENNYWLFGEQYHLVSADVNLETTLNNYLSFMEGKKKNKAVLSSKEKLKRPDVFIARKRQTEEIINDEFGIEENIIVELKRPSVVIGKEQYDQIEAYIRLIIDEPQFNSKLRKWRLILVGKSVDKWIQDRYDSQSNKGKKFLVEGIRNYEIYAYTWDDLFKIFDIRHKHLIDNLEFKEAILEHLQDSTAEKDLPDILVKPTIKNLENKHKSN